MTEKQASLSPVFQMGKIIFLLLFTLVTAQNGTGACLETTALSLCFDSARGTMKSLVEKQSRHDHIACEEIGDLWIVELPPNVGGRLTPRNAKEFSCLRDKTTPHTLHLYWRNFGLEKHHDLTVHISVTANVADPTTRWRIYINGLGDVCPAAIHFPRIPGIAEQQSEVLAVPYWIGEKTSHARQMFADQKRREWSYPGILSMQCITLYSENGPGVYLSADDIHARSKSFSVFGNEHNGIGIEAQHFPSKADTEFGTYTLPYEMQIGLFQGDWFTVAEIYRNWALEQPWAQASRLKKGLTPDWAKDTGFWIWNRDHSSGVLPPAIQMQDYLELPVSVFWHWWHGCPYDVGFPEYLPPREGSDAFRTALSNAQAQGIHAIIYMNQRLWGMTTDSWVSKNAERYAVKQPDGAVRPEVYNTFTKSPCASMCMGTSFWRNTYAGLAEEAFNALGVNGIYMDQACSSLVCYDTEHEHAPGGGDYWMKGFQSLESDIRKRCPNIVLAGEGVGESWLPHLDLMLSLQVSMERYAAPGQWEPIPFFNAVYHGHTIQYGNYASLTRPPYDSLWPQEFAPKTPLQLLDAKFCHQFRLEQGRSFVWGQQPCLANFTSEQLTKRSGELDFIRRLATLRNKALPWLLHGTFIRPPALNIPEIEIAMSRLSIYAGQHDAVQEYTKRVPQLLLSAWRNASGNIAVPIVNIGDEPMDITLRLNNQEHGLPDQGIVYKILPDERREIAHFEKGVAVITDTVNGAGTGIYEFTR